MHDPDTIQITHDWTRKRTAHNSACWECYRCHRACDGARPCKRCIDIDQGRSCRSPGPNEKIPRKRKAPKSDEQPPQRRAPHKIRKHTFFIVNPQMFYDSPSLPEKTEDPLSVPSSSSTNTFASPPNLDRTNESFVDLSGHHEILSAPSPQTVFQSSEPIFEPQLVQLPAPYYPTQQTQITRTEDFPLSLADLLAEFCVETEETEAAPDHHETTSSVFQSLTIPDDLMRLTESLFSPFCLRDSTQVLFP